MPDILRLVHPDSGPSGFHVYIAGIRGRRQRLEGAAAKIEAQGQKPRDLFGLKQEDKTMGGKGKQLWGMRPLQGRWMQVEPGAVSSARRIGEAEQNPFFGIGGGQLLGRFFGNVDPERGGKEARGPEAPPCLKEKSEKSLYEQVDHMPRTGALD